MKKTLISGFVLLALYCNSQNATVMPAKKSTVPQESELKINAQPIEQKNSQAATINSDAVPLPATRLDRPDTTLQLIITNPGDQKIITEPKKIEPKSNPK